MGVGGTGLPQLVLQLGTLSLVKLQKNSTLWTKAKRAILAQVLEKFQQRAASHRVQGEVTGYKGAYFKVWEV